MSEKFTINASDLQGFARMITHASVGITDLVEDMQNRIIHPTFLPSTPIQHLISGIASISYKSTRFGMKFFGGGLDKVFGHLHPLLGEGTSSNDKEFFLAILNGILGDYLENTSNPLTIPMQFRFQGKEITLDADSLHDTYPVTNGKVLLMIHGLCMNDIKWCWNEHDHGEKLRSDLDLTPVYLNYNGGRHISINGQNLNILLQQLVENWPVPLEELHIVAHSMGGLVSRSAFHYGQIEEQSWTRILKKIVFLGTPHHGTPLERAGNYLDFLLESTPYVKPFTRLNKIRSAGITDLRYGNLIDEDWEGIDRFKKLKDVRTHIPLPENVNCYNIAATRGNKKNTLSNLLVGDGLVPLKSALGQHNKPSKNLHFQDSNCHISYESNHMDLLDKPEIYERIRTWLSD